MILWGINFYYTIFATVIWGGGTQRGDIDKEKTLAT